jgi:SNF2 family DNA or RNA helicase
LLGSNRQIALLVVAPKNAFPAWDQTLTETLDNPEPSFVRLVGGRRRIESLLAEQPVRMLITYSQLVRVVDVVAEHMTRQATHLVLDESHKIKGGRAVQAGMAVNSIAPLAVRRDIMSGTPMPNSVVDLEAQFDFLYPAQGLGARIAAAASPRDAVAPFYVRTTKRELGLPAPIVAFEPIDMSDAQRALYGLARDQVIRNLKGLGRRQLTGLARASVMRLLQVAIDPQAAITAIRESDPLLANHPTMGALTDRLLNEDISPRMDRAIELALDVVSEGRKVVIWAPFTRTIRTLTSALAESGADAIYGAVPSGDESEEDTREGILLRFHQDPSRQVLVANPAAGGEGISLHRVCHDAIFVGRTYNAAHYLQARDRIHRLGLPEGAITRVTVLESRAPGGLGSIDLSVRRRLKWKVDQMGRVLDDTDLTQLALESDQADPTLDDGLTFDDLVDLVDELTNGRPAE